ncbi:hypothetical protein NP493_333g00010 [Ridgeia piscesae]|uniref:Sushi domain-containing protein n=1 Tax=Ridgeia piscesae TaxID=27915 RepID=A0AAD9L4D6_RIDPI|nr:hypothetical protein NP493_333g00010 [Ridgeia piscesae]
MATLILSATSEITCEALPEDPYGHYKNENCTARNATYDETCELECDDGYESSGDIDVLTCEQDGTWSSGAYCVAVKCPRLNKTSAEVYNEPSCTTETKFYNDTCELSCNIGYKLSRADGVRTCTENGTWSNPVKCEPENGVDMMHGILKRVWEEEQMPEKWKNNEIVLIYKQKGDPLECGNFRGIKLQEHGMKMFVKIVERRLRKLITVNNMQFGFSSGKGKSPRGRPRGRRVDSVRRDMQELRITPEDAQDRTFWKSRTRAADPS